MMLVTILALMTVGFGQIVSREEAQALNNQLGTQAYYAAESGVNYAISNGLTSGASTTSCRSMQVGPSANNVSNTCLLVNNTPQSLYFGDVDSDVTSFVGTTSSNIDTLDINWSCYQGEDASADCSLPTAGGNSLPTTAGYGSANTGVVQISITLLDAGDSRANLIDHTFTAFLYPNTTANPAVAFINGENTGQGIFINGNCTNTGSAATPSYTCSDAISGINSSQVLVRMQSFYASSTVSIKGLTSSNLPDPISGVQSIVDSTGKAQNVLKRIEEVVPLSGSSNEFANAAIEGDQVCKKLESNASGSAFITYDSLAQVDTGDTACNGNN